MVVGNVSEKRSSASSSSVVVHNGKYVVEAKAKTDFVYNRFIPAGACRRWSTATAALLHASGARGAYSRLEAWGAAVRAGGGG
eukprot:scaffold7016_cov123-Isochrysis_galbana.AAC.16